MCKIFLNSIYTVVCIFLKFDCSVQYVQYVTSVIHSTVLVNPFSSGIENLTDFILLQFLSPVLLMRTLA
jgi:hypothetical protein